MKGKITIIMLGLVVLCMGGVAQGKPPTPPSELTKGNHTLRWDTILDSTNGDNDPTTGCNSDRFKCIFGGAAVLDKETGLVWEQSLNTGLRDWDQSRSHCPNKAVGGRKGWRLPSFDELASLVDPNNTGGNPDLPSGHPFTNVLSGDYWSATSDALDSTSAWFVGAGSGTVDLKVKTGTGRPWCVRGGHNDGSAY